MAIEGQMYLYLDFLGLVENSFSTAYVLKLRKSA
jgi:hypothetical protein